MRPPGGRALERLVSGSGVDQQADPLGELLGDGLDDVALHGLPERVPRRVVPRRRRSAPWVMAMSRMASGMSRATP